MYSESGEREGTKQRREACRLKWLMMMLYRLGRLLGIVLYKTIRELRVPLRTKSEKVATIN